MSGLDFYEFGPFRLDCRDKVLRRGGEDVPLTPKLYDLLVVLVESAGRTVEKAELQQRVWGDTFVEEASLTRGVSRLRAALGAVEGDDQYIRTVARRGYRFVAAVSPGRLAAAPPPPAIERAASAPEVAIGAGSTSRARWRWPAAGLAVLAALALAGWWVFSPAPGVVGSLAVLPLRSLTSTEASATLALGLTDALITRLARTSDVVVRPTSAVLRFDRLGVDASQAARSLQVDAVVEGTVRDAEGRVRVSLQLLRADGRSIWAGQFDESHGDLLAIESAITERVADALSMRLHPPATGRAVAPEAHEAYLRGRALSNRLTADTLRRSIEHFERAIALEPTYAAAYTGLAFAHINTVDLVATPAEAFPRARAAAERALALDRSLADAHAKLGTVAMQFDWDWAAAERHFQRAIAADPNLAFARVYYGWLLALTGRFTESHEQIDAARRLDPVSIEVATTVPLTAYYERDVPLALARTREALELYPDLWLSHALHGRVLELGRDLPGAIAAFERASQLEGGVPEALMDLGRAYGKAGRIAEARAVLARLEALSAHAHVAPFQRAMIHVGLGDRDRAFSCLDDAVAQRSWYLSWLKVEPMLDTLRGDPRYNALLARVGFGPR